MKVACIDCEHCRYVKTFVVLHGGNKGEFSKCWVDNNIRWNPVTGSTYVKPEYCQYRNKKGDCKDYKPKKPTAPKWWQFWRK